LLFEGFNNINLGVVKMLQYILKVFIFFRI